MASNYKEISEDNELDLGRKRASRMSQVAMYADTAHFIYELLQNADDVDATEIHFSLSENLLVIEHNGTLFTDQNVRAISYFGMGKTDITKIGHFGLGFKSVFAYTASPKVHSGDESFEITDLYTVSETPYPEGLKPGRTRFVLPFDHHGKKPDYIERSKLKSAEDAYNEIAEKLANLGAETLLFTNTLKEIHWKTEEDEGHYLRDDSKVLDCDREVYIVTGDDENRCYLVFGRAVHWPDEDGIVKEHRPIQVAFKLDKRLEEGGSIEGIDGARLSVFFPTAIETHVEFILQGPYRTTPARDNVPSKDDFNQHLVNQTAQLVIECLPKIKELNLLGLDALVVLPINYDRFKEGTFFHPLYIAVRDALKNQPLLPTAEGSFVCGMLAKLAYGAELTNIFGSAELEQLFGLPGLNWIKSELTRDNYPTLHSFLIGKKSTKYQNVWDVRPLASEIEVDSKDIAKRITLEFMSGRSDDWIARFYSHLSGLTSGSMGHFVNRPIIRLEGDEHVIPFGIDKTPNAFLPFDEDDEDMFNRFPKVKRSLVQNEVIRQFLEQNIKLSTPNIADLVLSKILPKYTAEELIISLEAYKRDFKTIILALNADSIDKVKKEVLIKELKNAKICPVYNDADNSQIIYKEPSQVYLCTNDIDVYFDNNAYVVISDIYDEDDILILKKLGISDIPRVKKRSTDLNGNVDLKSPYFTSNHGNHERGLDGFDPDCTMEGLENAVTCPSLERSQLLWQYVLPYSQCIRGVIEKSGRKNFERIDKREEKISYSFGRILITSSWLPDRLGGFHLPAKIGLEDLPDGFEKNSGRAMELANKLGMRKPEEQQALAVLVKGDEKKRRILEQLLQADDDVFDELDKLLPKNQPPAKFKSFRNELEALHRPQRDESTAHPVSQGGVSSPARYQGKLDDATQSEVEKAKSQVHIVRFSLIRANSSNKEAREFLYAQYYGRCQVTGQTFVKADGRNYFEAVSLVPRLDSEHLNHAGNMLCLSAETAAKFMNASFDWIDDLKSKIHQFKTEKDDGTAVDRQIRIRLVGEGATITWSEQHFMRLISLWNHAS
jgi:hypothetical protein